MSDQNFYYCKHDVYFEDSCHYCEAERKNTKSELNYQKRRCLGVIESLRKRLQDVNGITVDLALKEAWEEINKL